ncbi:TIGR00341 family protein [Balneolaceae bacterium YR4-1]|uniref:TIGR00341 family protein n=1 Tax=Halalkalibaculum roseum TaxID=2709311 RepID=A0A6M1SPF5_9BACT|nr:TIGR00341 family protein [Halalkalibaculum roseum]NGP76979.1 TIGR00341 family protein [Halalkalibaculum roseum]
MDYRLLELMIPDEKVEEAIQTVEEQEPIGMWSDEHSNGYTVVRVLVDADKTENLSDTLSDKYANTDGFRILLFTIEATLPQPEREEKEEETTQEDEQETRKVGRISREELYADVTSGSELSQVYIALVILSTLVAAVGLMRDDVAVIIGAMVIAPLLGPNVSMALSVTLGDMQLAWRSLKANAAGLFMSLGIALVMGMVLNIDLNSEQIMSRTQVSLSDITIALAAGSAGVLAFTRGVPAAVVGVMVAVALLPPLVGIGLLLGSGYMQLAIGATILTFTNLICINLAGVVTFLLQGVRPRSWWEAEKAKKATRYAIVIWFVLLVIFAVLIWFWGQG